MNASTVISMDIASPSAANVWHEKPLLVSSLNLSLVKHLLLLPQFKHLSPLLRASLIHNAILLLHPVQVLPLNHRSAPIIQSTLLTARCLVQRFSILHFQLFPLVTSLLTELKLLLVSLPLEPLPRLFLIFLSKVLVVTSHRRQLFHTLLLRRMMVNFMWLVKHNSRCLLDGDKRITHSFAVVQDFKFPVLLGSDFMRLVRAVISYKKGTVTFGGPGPSQKATLSIFSVFTDQDGTAASVELTGPVGRVCVLTVSQSIPALLDPTVTSTIPISSHRDDSPSASNVLDHPTSSSSLRQASASTVVSEHLRASQKIKLRTLIDSYADVFAQTIDDRCRSTVATHRIDIGDHLPVNTPPYWLPPASREEVHKQIQCLVRNVIVRESRSPWASPVVLADKSEGTKRFCVDYRRVNACTKKDRYLLPRVDDSLDILSGKKCFTSLDLMSAYWQIPVAPEDIEKTAFITPVGLFEFTTMPFGVCNAPSSFQRAMDSVLAGLKWRTFIVYLDHILVFSIDFDSNLKDLETVFQRLRHHNIKLKPIKCNFA